MVAKKNFKLKNPADAFISTAEESAPTAPEREEAPRATAPDGYKLDPRFVETKSRRVQLLVQPSIFARLDQLAKRKGISRNEAFSEAVKAYLEREGA